MISVLIADDHVLFREGVRSLLEAAGGFRIVGDVGDGLTALSLARSAAPNVVLMDLQIPGLHGLDVIRQLRDAAPTTRVVVLSMHSGEAYVLEAIRSGALGYVLKDAAASELVRAIQAAAAGRRYLSPPLSDVVIDAYARRSNAGTVDVYETLSAREREVLRLIARGMTNLQVADTLDISARTVEAHRAKVMRKLGLKSKIDLILYAIRVGIVPADQTPDADD